MDISIVTVTWNSSQHIADQIRSVIGAATDLTYEHLIVDNDSADQTAAIVEREFPRLRLIKNQTNRGFAAANNQAVKEARGEFLLFLNPDMRFTEVGALKRWVEWMRTRPSVGLAGVQLIDESGQVNRQTTPRHFPRLADQLVIILKLHHLFPQLLNHYLMRGADFTREQAVDSVQGSCLLARRELIDQLGRAFDERYFIWFEDVDLCREAGRLGYEVRYAPIISCLDRGGQSFKQRNFLWKQAHFISSLIKYFQKWGLS